MTTIVTIILLFASSSLAFVPQIPRSRPARPLLSDFFGDVQDGETIEQVEDGRLSNEELEATAQQWGSHVPKFCHINLVGRVGNDPEPRYFDSGKVVLNLSLAVRRKYHPLERRALKIKEDATDWFSLELWGRDAEYATKYVTKGARVGVSGSLAVDSWADRETGQKRSKCTVIVKDLDILETKAEAELRRGGAGGGGQQQRGSQQRSFYADDDDDDDQDTFGSSAGTGGFFT